MKMRALDRDAGLRLHERLNATSARWQPSARSSVLRCGYYSAEAGQVGFVQKPRLSLSRVHVQPFGHWD
jgi:hypothetical protein